MKKIFSFFAAILFAGSTMAGSAIHYSQTLGEGSFVDAVGTTPAYITWNLTGVTVNQLKGSSSNNVNGTYNANLRVYKGHILSFEAKSGYVIDTIIISCNGSYFGNSMVAGTSVSENAVTEDNTNLTASIHYESAAKDTIFANEGKEVTAIYIQNVASGTNTQLRPSSIYVAYTKLASSDPEVVADDAVNFGTFVPGVSSASKQLDVVGLNLTAPITAELMMGSEFSISGTLTAEGGTLTVTLTDLVGGDKNDNLKLSVNSTLMKEVAVSAHVVETTGKGTKENPFTCPDVANLENTFLGNYWVEGYILGGYSGSGSAIDDEKNAAVLMAITTDSPIDTISVQLPNGSDIRTALNVPGNSSQGWKIKVLGSLEKYGDFAGVKAPTDYVIVSTPTAIDETEAAGKATKELREGQVLIIKGNKTYNILGQEIR